MFNLYHTPYTRIWRSSAIVNEKKKKKTKKEKKKTNKEKDKKMG